MAKRKPKHLAIVPKSGEKPKVDPPPTTRKLPEKAAEQIKKIWEGLQQAEQVAIGHRRRLTEATRLVVSAMGIDPDSKEERWELDPLTGILTKK